MARVSIAVDEDLPRLGATVEQAAGLADRVAQRHVFLQELELAAGAGGAERRERTLILIDVERVARLDVDVLARILDEVRGSRPFPSSRAAAA